VDTSTVFQHRKALLVTRHGKEQVIGPPLREAFGIELVTTDQPDTDLFGTFSGEVERPGDQLATVRLKVEAACSAHTGADLLLASEGAFFPHPDSPFLMMNRELILLKDQVHQLECIGRSVNLAPGIMRVTVHSAADALAQLPAFRFPAFGIILRATDRHTGRLLLRKDCPSFAAVEAAVNELLPFAADGKVEMEHDLRAHRNSDRMGFIADAAAHLVRVMQRCCPACGVPGFDVTDILPGLPCNWCGSPTRLVLAYQYTCTKCNAAHTDYFPNGKQTADPGSCDHCNP